MFGFIRAGAAVPRLEVGNPAFNREEILGLAYQGEKEGLSVLAFPELCLTGYTCGDLFYQSALLEEGEQALAWLAENTQEMDLLLALGMPVRADNQLFNCAVLLHKGRVLGAVPKTYLPNQGEFYEKRWFSSGLELHSSRVALCGGEVPIGGDLLFPCPGIPGLTVGVEVCEDLWSPIPPSSTLALEGASLLLNLSASNELVAKAPYRKELVLGQSARLMAGYVYASAGMWESTTDLVFGGHSLLCENGSLLAEGERFCLESRLLSADFDLELLQNNRRGSGSFMAGRDRGATPYRQVTVPLGEKKPEGLCRPLTPTPFVPPENRQRNERCAEIFAIQRTALARRFWHTGAKTAVLAVSGGLDSTLALLCTVKAFDFMGKSRGDITGITMPGFGTTGRTRGNALALLAALGCRAREIPIGEGCRRHLADIGHDGVTQDAAYENAQARERTQVAMDIANMENGLMVGPGDLSELALGFTTYGGDHMSMYNVNCGVPKTLVKALVAWIAGSGQLEAAACAVLEDILDTPISPELLPPDSSGRITQQTETLVGPYELHDFFLYHMVRNGFGPEKILFLADQSFEGAYSKQELVRWLSLFYRRFFSQQFKRSCMPDGPKVGSVALSPRGDWRMPSDASVRLWIARLEKEQEGGGDGAL